MTKLPMSGETSFFYRFRSFFSCREYTKLSCQKDLRNLSLSEKLAHRFHHLLCFTCRRFTHQVRFLDNACKRIMDESICCEDHKLSTEAKERISEKLKDT